STLRSYHGAQTFEAIGLSREVVDRYFTGTDSRIGGIGLKEIAREVLMFHNRAYVEQPRLLPADGVYQYRQDGEKHAWNPEVIHFLEWGVRTNDSKRYKQSSTPENTRNQPPPFIRGLLEFVPQPPTPMEEFEPAESIFRRLTTGAMSFGSISKAAHETI